LNKNAALFDQRPPLLLKLPASCVYLLGATLHLSQLDQSALIEVDQAAAFAGRSLNFTLEAL
jgi:hypothetical protein